MAAIVCQCASCASRFKVDSAYEGRKVKCPRCSAAVLVAPAAVPANSAQPSLKPPSPPTAIPPAAKPPQARPVAAAVARPVAQPAPAVAAPIAPAMPQPAAPPADPSFPLSASAADSPVAALFSMPSAPQIIVQASPTAGSSAIKPKKKSGLPIGLLAAAGGAVLATVIGVIIFAALMLGGDGDKVAKKNKNGTGPTGGGAELVLDWPESDRRGAAVTIDGDTQSVRASGDIKFALSPGEHKLLIRRRGFEPIEATVKLSAGQTEHFAPEFKASEAAAVVTAPPNGGDSSIALSTGGGTPFQIGGAASTSPAGFVGFLQNLGEAKREAAKAKKSILIVFGSSDADEDSQELASLMQAPDVKTLLNQHFIPVVIDFPRTREGYSLVQDTAQNRGLIQEYQIQSLPTVVLADEKARPYFVERKWKEGFGDLATRFEGWLAERQKRDDLILAAQAETDPAMPAAKAAVQWINQHELWGPYESELTGFHQKAQTHDPSNEQGLLEVFIEGVFFTRHVEVQEGDHTGIDLLQHLLEPLTKSGCKDPDRGAKLHMVMAMHLRSIKRNTQVEAHLTKAASYQPTDRELAQAMASLRQALENKDVLSTGTGFLISEAGYLLTNHHVIEGDGSVVVRIPGQEEPVPVEVIARDGQRDMALLKIELPAGTSITPIALSKTDLEVGATIATYGYPLGAALGKESKFTAGVVSSTPEGAADNMALLDLRVNPGNSGGPLCDTYGNVVGMVTAKTNALGLDSYAMALPAKELLAFLDTHLPADVTRPEAAESTEEQNWVEVGRRVRPAVLMIMKMRK